MAGIWSIAKVLVAIIGLASLPLFGYFLFQSYQIKYNSYQVEGTVIDLADEEGQRRIIYSYFAEGEERTARAGYASDKVDVDVGDPVKVLVSHRNPAWAALAKPGDIWAMPIVFGVGVIGSVFFFFLFSYFEKKEKLGHEAKH